MPPLSSLSTSLTSLSTHLSTLPPSPTLLHLSAARANLELLREGAAEVKRRELAGGGSTGEVNAFQVRLKEVERRVDRMEAAKGGSAKGGNDGGGGVAGSDSDRAELLQGAAREPGGLRRRKKPTGGGDSAASSSSSSSSDAAAVNSSLLRTRSLLASELLRVSEVSSTIEGDSRVLSQVSDEAGSLSDVAGRAGKVLRGIGRNAMKEEMALWLSVGFFGAVVLYVVYRRAWVPFLFY